MEKIDRAVRAPSGGYGGRALGLGFWVEAAMAPRVQGGGGHPQSMCMKIKHRRWLPSVLTW